MYIWIAESQTPIREWQNHIDLTTSARTVYIPQKGYVFSEVWCTYLENIFSPKMYSSILENTLILLPGTFFGIFLF